MTISSSIFWFALATSSVSASNYLGDELGAGLGPTELINQLPAEHNITSNSAPFKFGNSTFRLQVNVTQLAADGLGSNVTDPVVAFSNYILQWPGNSSLIDTVMEAEGSSNLTSLGAKIVRNPLSLKATNAYDSSNPGSCVGPFGQKCVDALRHIETNPYGTPGQWQIPDECDELKVMANTFIGPDKNITSEPQPAPFAWYASPFYSNPSTQKVDPRDDGVMVEEERLHVLLFSGLKIWPVCLRVKDDKESKNSPGVSGAPSIKSPTPWLSVMTGLLGVAAFL